MFDSHLLDAGCMTTAPLSEYESYDEPDNIAVYIIADSDFFK
jgi:hypothetical protein